MSASAYSELETRFRRMSLLGEAAAILGWDKSVLMPAGGAGARAEQLAALSVLGHELISDPALADLLDAAEADRADLDPWQNANLIEMRRDWRHATAVDASLVEALSKAASTCEMAWRQARADDDFATFRPHQETVLELVKEAAAAKGDAFGCAPYDALLDQFEPGVSADEIDTLFADLEAFLPGFVGEALEAQAVRGVPEAPQGPFAVEAQRRLGEDLMRALGFDFNHGRLDVSLHPFTGGVPDDVRLTTRYTEDDFTQSLMGTLHETGHALYEMGLPADWRHQPVGVARGMVLHESQSLLVEMQVCRGEPFLRYAAPLMQKAFGGEGPVWSVENLKRLYQRVERGLIRVDADEATYPLHVILRTRLERAMIAGDLAIADLPVAWNDGMAELVGITPPNDADGCLQDIHWPDGAFGYFPTYTLGALAAAQLFAAARAAIDGLDDLIAAGDFAPLIAWVRENVHQWGSRHGTDAVLERATNQPLKTDAFKAHLKVRYLN